VKRWKEGDRVLSIPYPDYLTGRVTQENLRNSMGTSGNGTDYSCLIYREWILMLLLGVLCEWRIFKEEALLPTPKEMTDVEACTLQVAGVTAWMAMNGSRPLGSPGGKGEVILIQGTGGVAINGLRIAKASSAEGTYYSIPNF